MIFNSQPPRRVGIWLFEKPKIEIGMVLSCSKKVNFYNSCANKIPIHAW